MVTSTWASGHPGPVCFCVPDGYLSKKWVKDFNRKWLGKYHILFSGGDSHFMTSDTTIHMYECLYKPAFSQRRTVLGLDMSDWGAYIHIYIYIFH